MKAGDIVMAVENKTLEASENSMTILRKTIQDSPQKPLNFLIKRGEKTIFMTITPELGDNGQGKIGVMLAPNGEIIRRRPENPLEAFTVGAEQFQRLINLTLQGFGQLISNFQENAKQLAGPVAIVAVGAQLAQNDLANLFQFGALISINLAVINILPLPVLDGGQLVFLLAEGLRGKPLPTQLQEGIMQTGVVLLLGLAVFLIVRDTTNLAFFQQLFLE
jgi:RIP metalloprotease RseP